MSCEPKKLDYVWTESDQQPEINFTLPDSQLVSDFTITLSVDRPDGTVEAIAATDLGGSLGKFAWAPTSLIAGENQRCQFKQVNALNETQTLEDFLIDVKEAVS